MNETSVKVSLKESGDSDGEGVVGGLGAARGADKRSSKRGERSLSSWAVKSREILMSATLARLLRALAPRVWLPPALVLAA